MEKLIQDMNAANDDFECQLKHGNMAAKALESRKLEMPMHDPMEYGSKYEKDMQNWARMRLEYAEALLQQRWENCALTADYITQSMLHQDEASTLLAIAYSARPKLGTRSWNLGVDRAQESHDKLKTLQADLSEFTQTSLTQRYNKANGFMDAATEPMNRMKQEHAAFIRHLDRYSPQELCDETNKFISEASAVLNNIIKAKEILFTCTSDIPDLEVMSTVFQPVIPQARRLR